MNIAGEFAIDGFHLRITKFALVAGRYFAAQMMRHKLHAVADAQYRYAQIKNTGIGLIIGVVHRIGAAGKNNSFGVEGFDFGQWHIEGMQFAIHMRFAHAAGNQLGDLRAEVEDEDFVLGHDGLEGK